MASFPFWKLLYNNSILQACDNNYFLRQQEKYRGLTFCSKVIIGFKSGVYCLTRNYVVVIALNFLISKYLVKTNLPLLKPLTSYPFLMLAVAVPLFEELIFRGFMHNYVRFIQKLLPTNILSASFRILFSGLTFALAHWYTDDSYWTFTDSLIQVASLVLYPDYSCLYEKTGSLIVPIVAHMTNNAIIYLICKLFGY